MKFIKTPVKGMCDMLPADMRLREHVLGMIKETYGACGFSIGFERIVTILKDHEQGSFKLPEGSVAYLIGNKVPTARKAEVLAQAAEARKAGVVATVLPMSKNMKHQIELLEAEGFTKFEKIYE